MELQQLYNDYYIQIIVGLVLTFSLLGFLLYLTVKSYLLNKALEFHDAPKTKKNDCQKDSQNYFVNDGIKEKSFTTPNGALIYCNAVYNKTGNHPKVYFCENGTKVQITTNCLRRAISQNNAFRYIES